MSNNVLTYLFGRIPDLININLKYLIYNDESNCFTCNRCGKHIKINSDSEYFTSKQFNAHLLSEMHLNNTVSSDVHQSLIKTFSENVPQIVLNNLFALEIDNCGYYCAVCETIICASSFGSQTEVDFSYHLLSQGHVVNLEKHLDALEKLHEVYSRFSQVVQNNTYFLNPGKNCDSYFCNACNEQLLFHSTDPDKTKYNFEKHFHSFNHLQNAKSEKAFARLPVLSTMFTSLPNYILRNYEYLSANGSDIFCSLCNYNIKLNPDPYMLEQGFKLHLLSSTHHSNLFYRRSTDNKVYIRLHSMFETFSDVVLENLKYVTLYKNNLSCSICNQIIDDKNNNDHYEIGKNITNHFESDVHASRVNDEDMRQSEIVEELINVFGAVPESIQNNIEYIEFRGRNIFECVLCPATLQSSTCEDNEYAADITENNFEKHLQSSTHESGLEYLQKESEALQTALGDLFESIPQFIANNWDHLVVKDSDDFHCYLCDEPIPRDRGTMGKEVTVYNFRTHLLSKSHISLLKQKAFKEMEAEEELGAIFGQIPDFILTNLEHIFKNEDRFYCQTCNTLIEEGEWSSTTEGKFHKHLHGKRHGSALQEIEDAHTAAMQQLDKKFSRVPEFLLRNIDFFECSEEKLYCVLCQKHLKLDGDDLVHTKNTIRSHLESAKHQFNVNNL